MLPKGLQDALNEQIKNELYSAYLYLGMSAYFEATNLPGFAHWMRVQAREEVSHAMKFFDFINDREGRVQLQAISQPPGDFRSPLDAFQQALEHERRVTGNIRHLRELAMQTSDYEAEPLLEWFIGEQVEEEKTASSIGEQLKRVGDQGVGLLILDRELGQRKASANET